MDGLWLLREYLRRLEQFFRCLQFPFRMDHLGAPFTFRIEWKDGAVSDYKARDLRLGRVLAIKGKE